MELNSAPHININSIDCMTLSQHDANELIAIPQGAINRQHYSIHPKALAILKTPLYSSYFVTAKSIQAGTINDSKEILCDCNSLLNFQCLLAFVHAYVAHVAQVAQVNNLPAPPQLDPPGTSNPPGPDDPLNPAAFNDVLRGENSVFMVYLNRVYDTGQLMRPDPLWDDLWRVIEERFNSYVVVGIDEAEAQAAVDAAVALVPMGIGGRGKSRRRIKMSKRNKPIKIYTKNKNNKKTKTRKLKGKKRTRKLKGKKRTLKKRRNKTNKRHK
jgi:hypothetical protein